MVIGYDTGAILKRFAGRRGITLRLLSDPGNKTIDAYGIRNQAAVGRLCGIPHPGAFPVDQQGIIRAKLFHEGDKDRLASDEIFKAATPWC